ncbi:hypothetical protein AMAG_17669 [Allomyces macrogynus ATCC 38327]|uniref:USP domain-containing protein n=1 Tax=Allomyces macrogynus (strain ATCC 38327) TaxID=578462 RepID=A0A0L0RWC7_ALLM3|nr:hypothetical protein AMAG_17669 [Allomyces macrogynus ATCC 38327]|eukprot:KNE54405.1 hypothetical protein AMAG_17669 [Allomyces macrogynus ATCC 38327]
MRAPTWRLLGGPICRRPRLWPRLPRARTHPPHGPQLRRAPWTWTTLIDYEDDDFESDDQLLATDATHPTIVLPRSRAPSPQPKVAVAAAAAAVNRRHAPYPEMVSTLVTSSDDDDDDFDSMHDDLDFSPPLHDDDDEIAILGPRKPARPSADEVMRNHFQQGCINLEQRQFASCRDSLPWLADNTERLIYHDPASPLAEWVVRNALPRMCLAILANAELGAAPQTAHQVARLLTAVVNAFMQLDADRLAQFDKLAQVLRFVLSTDLQPIFSTNPSMKGRLIQHFFNNQGPEKLFECAAQPNVSLEQLSWALQALAGLGDQAFVTTAPRDAVEAVLQTKANLFQLFFDVVQSRLAALSEADTRNVAPNTIFGLLEALLKLDQVVAHRNARTLCLALLKCPALDRRLLGITLLRKLAELIRQAPEHAAEHHHWLQDENVLDLVFAGEPHPEIVARAGDVLVELARDDGLSDGQIDTFWQLATRAQTTPIDALLDRTIRNMRPAKLDPLARHALAVPTADWTEPVCVIARSLLERVIVLPRCDDVFAFESPEWAYALLSAVIAGIQNEDGGFPPALVVVMAQWLAGLVPDMDEDFAQQYFPAMFHDASQALVNHVRVLPSMILLHGLLDSVGALPPAWVAVADLDELAARLDADLQVFACTPATDEAEAKLEFRTRISVWQMLRDPDRAREPASAQDVLALWSAYFGAPNEAPFLAWLHAVLARDEDRQPGGAVPRHLRATASIEVWRAARDVDPANVTVPLLQVLYRIWNLGNEDGGMAVSEMAEHAGQLPDSVLFLVPVLIETSDNQVAKVAAQHLVDQLIVYWRTESAHLVVARLVPEMARASSATVLARIVDVLVRLIPMIARKFPPPVDAADWRPHACAHAPRTVVPLTIKAQGDGTTTSFGLPVPLNVTGGQLRGMIAQQLPCAPGRLRLIFGGKELASARTSLLPLAEIGVTAEGGTVTVALSNGVAGPPVDEGVSLAAEVMRDEYQAVLLRLLRSPDRDRAAIVYRLLQVLPSLSLEAVTQQSRMSAERPHEYLYLVELLLDRFATMGHVVRLGPMIASLPQLDVTDVVQRECFVRTTDLLAAVLPTTPIDADEIARLVEMCVLAMTASAAPTEIVFAAIHVLVAVGRLDADLDTPVLETWARAMSDSLRSGWLTPAAVDLVASQIAALVGPAESPPTPAVAALRAHLWSRVADAMAPPYYRVMETVFTADRTSRTAQFPPWEAVLDALTNLINPGIVHLLAFLIEQDAEVVPGEVVAEWVPVVFRAVYKGFEELDLGATFEDRERLAAAVTRLLGRTVAVPGEHVQVVHDLLLEFLAEDGLQCTEWEYNPRVFCRSHYVGLKNLGATCYQNSMLQQFFMDPAFRNAILTCPTTSAPPSPVQPPAAAADATAAASAPAGPAAPAPAPEPDRFLAQLQAMFAHLHASQRHEYDTRPFVRTLKDFEGKPLNEHVQMDGDEFFNMVFDRLEAQVQDLPQGRLLTQRYGGKLQHLVESVCTHKSVREEQFHAIQCEVKGQAGLAESLALYVRGDALSGDNQFRCDECDKKVDAVKSTRIRELPERLIFHLKRFDFDMERFCRFKVNDSFTFPHVLDMRPYLTAERQLELENDPAAAEFELVGVLVHTGTADSGHYYSYIKCTSAEPPYSAEGDWFQFNDCSVTPFDAAHLPTLAYGGDGKQYSAYMLFYQQRRRPVDKVQACDVTVPDKLLAPIQVANRKLVRDTLLFDRHLIDLASTLATHHCQMRPYLYTLLRVVVHSHDLAHALPVLRGAFHAKIPANDADWLIAALIKDGPNVLWQYLMLNAIPDARRAIRAVLHVAVEAASPEGMKQLAAQLVTIITTRELHFYTRTWGHFMELCNQVCTHTVEPFVPFSPMLVELFEIAEWFPATGSASDAMDVDGVGPTTASANVTTVDGVYPGFDHLFLMIATIAQKSAVIDEVLARRLFEPSSERQPRFLSHAFDVIQNAETLRQGLTQIGERFPGPLVQSLGYLLVSAANVQHLDVVLQVIFHLVCPADRTETADMAVRALLASLHRADYVVQPVRAVFIAEVLKVVLRIVQVHRSVTFAVLDPRVLVWMSVGLPGPTLAVREAALALWAHCPILPEQAMPLLASVATGRMRHGWLQMYFAQRADKSVRGKYCLMLQMMYDAAALEVTHESAMQAAKFAQLFLASIKDAFDDERLLALMLAHRLLEKSAHAGTLLGILDTSLFAMPLPHPIPLGHRNIDQFTATYLNLITFLEPAHATVLDSNAVAIAHAIAMFPWIGTCPAASTAAQVVQWATARDSMASAFTQALWMQWTAARVFPPASLDAALSLVELAAVMARASMDERPDVAKMAARGAAGVLAGILTWMVPANKTPTVVPGAVVGETEFAAFVDRAVAVYVRAVVEVIAERLSGGAEGDTVAADSGGFVPAPWRLPEVVVQTVVEKVREGVTVAGLHEVLLLQWAHAPMPSVLEGSFFDIAQQCASNVRSAACRYALTRLAEEQETIRALPRDRARVLLDRVEQLRLLAHAGDEAAAASSSSSSDVWAALQTWASEEVELVADGDKAEGADAGDAEMALAEEEVQAGEGDAADEGQC